MYLQDLGSTMVKSEHLDSIRDLCIWACIEPPRGLSRLKTQPTPGKLLDVMELCVLFAYFYIFSF